MTAAARRCCKLPACNLHCNTCACARETMPLARPCNVCRQPAGIAAAIGQLCARFWRNWQRQQLQLHNDCSRSCCRRHICLLCRRLRIQGFTQVPSASICPSRQWQALCRSALSLQVQDQLLEGPRSLHDQVCQAHCRGTERKISHDRSRLQPAAHTQEVGPKQVPHQRHAFPPSCSSCRCSRCSCPGCQCRPPWTDSSGAGLQTRCTCRSQMNKYDRTTLVYRCNCDECPK